MEGAAELTRIRVRTQAALDRFLAAQRSVLTGISPELAPVADAIADLVAGGKRLRPAFCYWGWRACGGDDEPAVFAAAAALELLHASALVHDDVMDESDTRRGQPSVHKRFDARHQAANWQGSAGRFGAGAAILTGDLLLSWTDEMLRTSGLPVSAVTRGLAVLDAMRTEVLAGQFLDLAGQAKGGSSVESALQVITFKSAKYTVERPLQLGAALLADTPRAITAALSGYGVPLGIAFQLRDDILGVFGDPEKTGKPVLDDLREGKRTVMLAIARNRADDAQAELLDRCVGDPDLSEEVAGYVQEVIVRTGALDECELMITVNVKEALAALAGAPVTPRSKEALADLAIATTSRSS
ncbi:MAG TPA: polyprenyl synthetase family protein [Streptosporangiaceae bacterium]|nr:polyprenyl synthetase family protein [Streptosporangiaceae bacterium]